MENFRGNDHGAGNQRGRGLLPHLTGFNYGYGNPHNYQLPDVPNDFWLVRIPLQNGAAPVQAPQILENNPMVNANPLPYGRFNGQRNNFDYPGRPNGINFPIPNYLTRDHSRAVSNYVAANGTIHTTYRTRVNTRFCTACGRPFGHTYRANSNNVMLTRRETPLRYDNGNNGDSAHRNIAIDNQPHTDRSNDTVEDADENTAEATDAVNSE